MGLNFICKHCGRNNYEPQPGFAVPRCRDCNKEYKVLTVKPCWNSVWYGVECLESDDEYGFFKSDHDRRPSSCTWIKKYKDLSEQSTLDRFDQNKIF